MAAGRTMLVMEFVEGGDLWRALQRGAAAAGWRQQGRRIAQDIARGLCFLHARSIVYAPRGAPPGGPPPPAGSPALALHPAGLLLLESPALQHTLQAP